MADNIADCILGELAVQATRLTEGKVSDRLIGFSSIRVICVFCGQKPGPGVKAARALASGSPSKYQEQLHGNRCPFMGVEDI